MWNNLLVGTKFKITDSIYKGESFIIYAKRNSSISCYSLSELHIDEDLRTKSFFFDLNIDAKGDAVQIIQTNENGIELICLSDRVDEFHEATKRSKNQEFEVFADFNNDNFVIINQTNDSEYRVNFQYHYLKIYASCECADFDNRERVCKHINETCNFITENIEVRYSHRYTAYAEYGNFKRQHHADTKKFNKLEDAKNWVTKSIGNLQGFGYVLEGSNRLWETSVEREHYEEAQQMQAMEGMV